MTQKERLVELLGCISIIESTGTLVLMSKTNAESLADYLLSNGVIVPTHIA